MNPAIDESQILLWLAWLGMAQTPHLANVGLAPDHYKDPSEQVREVLTHLTRLQHIECLPWNIPHTRGKPPIKQPYLWRLASKGVKHIARHPLFPKTFRPARDWHFKRHDSMTSAIAQKIIQLRCAKDVQSAPQYGPLSGVYVQRETGLNLEAIAPIADAVMSIMSFNTAPWDGFGVPWVHKEQGDIQRFAIEADTGTEKLRVLEEKVKTYQTTYTKAWEETYGQFPTLVWYMTMPTRALHLVTYYAQHNPHGQCLITTEPWVRQGHDMWLGVKKGQPILRGLYHGQPCYSDDLVHDLHLCEKAKMTIPESRLVP